MPVKRAKTFGKKTGGAAKKKAAAKKSTPKKSTQGNLGKTNNAPRKKAGSGLKAAKQPLVAAVKQPAKIKTPAHSALVEIILRALDDIKAVNITTLDVRGVTDIADTMVIASGNSDRHVRSIADRVVEFAKKAGFRPMGVEGERDSEWVLVDLTDVIVHVMLPRVREFYRLESLWDVTAARREAAGQ